MLESFQFITVFLEGIISFFSPCIIPILPLYMSYLAGSAKKVNKDGTIYYKRSTTLFHTFFFILGISASFFILGLSFTALGLFFQNIKHILLIICGIIIIILGFFQMGLIKIKFLQKERKMNVNLNIKKINPFFAFLLGFLFSFAWTPCVGPALASVLLMAGTAESSSLGFFYIFLYTIGFVIPFLVLGIFADALMGWLQKSKKALVWTTRIGAVLLIIMGGLLLSGWVTSDSFQSAFPGVESSSSTGQDSSSAGEPSSQPTESSSSSDSSSASSRPVVPDYIVQRKQFMESMKMTKQEVKQEYKETEGDPLVKGRLRQYMHEMLSRNMPAAVAKSDVVITNPTHYAVAVQYDGATMQGPTVMAKGVDAMARRIKEIAKENNVPLVENRPLARALYSEVDVGEMVPENYYQALAVILANVYNMRGK